MKACEISFGFCSSPLSKRNNNGGKRRNRLLQNRKFFVRQFSKPCATSRRRKRSPWHGSIVSGRVWIQEALMCLLCTVSGSACSSLSQKIGDQRWRQQDAKELSQRMWGFTSAPLIKPDAFTMDLQRVRKDQAQLCVCVCAQWICTVLLLSAMWENTYGNLSRNRNSGNLTQRTK